MESNKSASRIIQALTTNYAIKENFLPPEALQRQANGESDLITPIYPSAADNFTGESPLLDTTMSSEQLNELCRTFIKSATTEFTPFWHRASTIWITVTLSLFVLTLIAGAINVYIHFLQHTRKKKVSFYSFITSTSGMKSGDDSGGGGVGKETRKMKFKGLKSKR